MKRLLREWATSVGRTIPQLSSAARQSDLYAQFYPEESIRNKRFYNIGAGGFSHPHWTNVDYDSEWYKKSRKKTLRGIQYDLFSLEPLPIDSNSAEVVYSSHTIEHIVDPAAQRIFSEMHRILKPGGYLRITAPDIDLHYRAYRENDRSFFYWKDWYRKPKKYRRIFLNGPLDTAPIEQLFLQRFASSLTTLHSDGARERIGDEELRTIFAEKSYADALNYCCARCPVEVQKKYPGNHMNWWNIDKVTSMLREAGFTTIYVSGYGQSHCAILRDLTLFDNTHPKVSFYVEATK